MHHRTYVMEVGSECVPTTPHLHSDLESGLGLEFQLGSGLEVTVRVEVKG
jgi:hypothetical protein